MEQINQPAKPTRAGGRQKFARNHRTLDLDILEAISSEALEDGRLCLTYERAGYALQVDLSTIRSLVASGDLPAFGLGNHREKRFMRIPAEAVLELVRSRTPKIRTLPILPPSTPTPTTSN